MYKISDKIINFIMNAIENWRVDLIERSQIQVEVKIQIGNLQRDPLSWLLFVKELCHSSIYLGNARRATNLQKAQKI